MKRQIFQIATILLILEAGAVGAYLIWGIDRTGDLAIISNPPGARVLLNLEPTTYLTDTLITDLPQGKYSVTLEKKGFITEPFVQVVHLQRNLLSAVSFDLKPAPPPTAQAQPIKTPKETEKTRPDYQPSFPMPTPTTSKLPATDTLIQSQTRERPPLRTSQGKQTTTQPSKISRTTTEPQQQFGSVEVASNIFGADILMDGRPTGQQTNATLMVPTGIHRFSIKKENFTVQPEEVIVNVQSSETGEFIMFELTQDLESQPFRIQVTTEPVPGGVLIDNIYRGVGTVNLEVDPGEYLVAFQPVSGYETPHSVKVTLTPNKRLAAVTGKYERRLEFTMFIDSLGRTQQTDALRIDVGYFIKGEGFTPDTLWGPAVKYVKSLNNYAWELGWGIATRNPTGSDYIRFRFDVPQDFTRTKPLTMRLYIFASSKNYPLTMMNKVEVDMTVNGELVWENHKPETDITQGLPDKYEELPLDRYLRTGSNEVVIKASDTSQCFIYFRGIEIR